MRRRHRQPGTGRRERGGGDPLHGLPRGRVRRLPLAARTQENTQVAAWLATTADSADLNELLRVYTSFGSASGFFWAVSDVAVTSVAASSAGRADVTLSGDVVWCIGASATDSAATCSAVTAEAGHPRTYAAVLVDGRWKADVDVNASSGIDHNPQGRSTAAAATATPSPT